MKVKKLHLFLVSCILAACISPVFAAESSSDAFDSAVAEEAEARSDTTKTYYRTYNGRLQYRIWSVSEGRWLTDWIDL